MAPLDRAQLIEELSRGESLDTCALRLGVTRRYLDEIMIDYGLSRAWAPDRVPIVVRDEPLLPPPATGST